MEKIVELDIDIEELDKSLFEDFGVDIVSMVEAPAFETSFVAFSNQEFIKPNVGESEDDFIGRCMGDSKMVSEYGDEEQRLAVCYSYFEGGYEFETYNDYPESARNNACKALKWAEENGWGDCGTDVGKQRANQLCKGENISKETIARMSSFARHEQHKDVPYSEGCGGLMWDAWGGTSGINWAQSKLKELEELSCEGGSCEREIMSEEHQKEILDFCEMNGEYLDKDDLVLDLSKDEFSGLGDVITAIRSLDILKRLNIKTEDKPKKYYRYSGPPAERNFCKAMMNLSKAGKIFSREEINKMDGINSRFAKKGKSSYSIFSWAGGKNCKHWWEPISVFKNEEGKRVVIVGSPQTKAEERASTPWASLFFSVDDDKRIVLGPVLIPNKKVIRADEFGNPYYVFFTKKTIKKIAEKFFKESVHNNTDINHDNNVVQENTLLESWISESEIYDKSYKYGFNLPRGTWFLSYKINNEETWRKIKNGELTGFSLAGNFLRKMEVSEESKLEEIKKILKEVE